LTIVGIFVWFILGTGTREVWEYFVIDKLNVIKYNFDINTKEEMCFIILIGLTVYALIIFTAKAYLFVKKIKHFFYQNT
jgi:hypothetical protein